MAVKFDQWLTLSETEKQAEQACWNPYGEGYWHGLLSEAAKQFESEFASVAHVRDVHSGTYHGGELIIGVSTDLPYPQTITLPDSYLGFRVMQFCGGTPEPLPSSDANHLTMRWSERRTTPRPHFKMTSTHSLRAMRALVRRRSSYSR